MRRTRLSAMILFLGVSAVTLMTVSPETGTRLLAAAVNDPNTGWIVSWLNVPQVHRRDESFAPPPPMLLQTTPQSPLLAAPQLAADGPRPSAPLPHLGDPLGSDPFAGPIPTLADPPTTDPFGSPPSSNPPSPNRHSAPFMPVPVPQFDLIPVPDQGADVVTPQQKRYLELLEQKAHRMSEDELQGAIKDLEETLTQQDQDAQELLQECLNQLDQLISDHPGTPAAKAAAVGKREIDAALKNAQRIREQ